MRWDRGMGPTRTLTTVLALNIEIDVSSNLPTFPLPKLADCDQLSCPSITYTDNLLILVVVFATWIKMKIWKRNGKFCNAGQHIFYREMLPGVISNNLKFSMLFAGR